MPDSYTHMYECVCVCVLIPEHRIHQVGSEANLSLWRLNTFFWGDEMVEWVKAQSDRFCPRVESISLTPLTDHLHIPSVEMYFQAQHIFRDP